MPTRSRSTFTLPLIILVSIVAGVFGCSNETGELIDNIPPFIRITGGPPEGQRDSYTARIWWTGWDDDGVIDHYEYTIDPPLAFSPEEVNSPEDFLADGTLSLRRILGPEDDTDTLRYSKVVDGTSYSFDYIQTRDFSRSFAFETPNADSVQEGSLKLPDDKWFGSHTVYVRAQDNDETYSDVDRLGYTAVTTTPSGFITRPVLGPQFLQVGEQIRFSWDGLDPDSPEARKKPTAYLYKLVRLDKLTPPIPILSVTNPAFVVYRLADHIPWVWQSAETTSASFFLEGGGNYLFALRAVDVAGAEEPFIDFLRGAEPGNAVLLQALSQAGSPELCVTEPTLGSGCGRGDKVFEYEVPVGQRLNFSWQGSAETYGGVVEGYNWGINIPDIEKDGPNSGWRGWSTLTRNVDPIVFKKPGINVVYVKARDSAGAQTVVTVILNVVEFPLDREILIVDDYKDGVWPRDDRESFDNASGTTAPSHDDFWFDLLANSGRFEESDLLPEIVIFNSHGPGDNFFTFPVAPKLEELGRYKMIIYDTKGSGYNGFTGLIESGPKRRHLGAYLGAGGKLWVSGEQTIAAMMPTVTGTADFVYDPPKEMNPRDFPYDFLKIYSSEIRNEKYVDSDIHGMVAVEPWPGGPAPYPQMDVDWTKVRPTLRNKFGIGGTDAVFGAIFEGTESNFSGQIDSLYAYRMFGPNGRTPPKNSPYERKLAGIRWFDESPDRAQGRVMWFGFPMYYFMDDQAQETFNRAIDWFREETPPDL